LSKEEQVKVEGELIVGDQKVKIESQKIRKRKMSQGA
jgi:hypothetical protein